MHSQHPRTLAGAHTDGVRTAICFLTSCRFSPPHPHTPHHPITFLYHPKKTTVLNSAAIGGSSEAVAVVLAAGANVNTQSSNGATPLHWAVLNDRPAAVTQLLSSMKCDLELRNQDGRTALDLGERYGNMACVALLKQYAADPAAFGECTSFLLPPYPPSIPSIHHMHTHPHTYTRTRAHARTHTLLINTFVRKTCEAVPTMTLF